VIDGKKTEFRFNILLNSGNRRREQIALIFVDELKKLGIGAGTTSLEWATFLERTRDAKYEAMIAGWAMNPTESDMYQIWHSASAVDGGSNHVRYRSPEVDKLIEQIRGEFDFEKRKEHYKQIQRIINEDQPYTFLVSEQQTGAYHSRFQNVNFYAPRPCYDAGEWWVPLSAQKYKTAKSVAQM
jgi:peptide/nickel transport system substrate-binding protein